MYAWKFFSSTTLGLGLLLGHSLPCQADTLSGRVHQIDSQEVFVQINDSTTVKVPVKDAVFRVHGEPVQAGSLLVGQHIVVDYTPLHGFQQYYHTSSDLEGSKTVFILSDSPDDISVVELDGDLYRPVED